MIRGTQTWLISHLNKYYKSYERELAVHDSLSCHEVFVNSVPHADVMSMDLMEIFAGRGRVSELAPRFDLRAIQPIDLKYGQKLLDAKTRKSIMNTVHKLKPLLLIIEWPCTFWNRNIFSENLNYSWRLDELEELRESDRPLVNFGVELCKKQAREGRFYLGENPLRSRIWTEPPVQELRDDPDCLQVECDAGAYGAEASDGSLIIKPHRWITS